MGIIIRQSVRSSIWSYLGIAIGYVNVGIIMPQFFTTDQVGLVQIFASISLIMAQFGTLGFLSTINRLFPLFRSPKLNHNGFPFLIVLVGLSGFIITMAGFLTFKPWIIQANIEKSPLLVDYLWLLVPLVLMRIAFLLLDHYNKMLYDSVTGTFWMEFAHKLINLALVILFAFGWLNFTGFFYWYVVSMSLPAIPLIFVLVKRKSFKLRPNIQFLDVPLRKEILTVMLFGFINGLAGILLLNVDKIYVNRYLSLHEVGIFGVCSLFALIIRVPFNAMSKISTSIISEAWNSHDLDKIREIYRKFALNQAILGWYIFILIIVNMQNIFTILPPVYSNGKWVLVIYSAGMLLNTIIGLAGYITETSRHYRMVSYFLLFSVIVQFVLSMILIPSLGLIGAAIATIAAVLTNSFLQAGFQAYKFRIIGLTKHQVTVLGIGLVCLALGWFLPDSTLVVDILYKSFLVTVLFFGSVLALKVSEDMNSMIKNAFLWITGKHD